MDVIEQHALLTQLVVTPTRGNAELDKILTNVQELYAEPVICAPIASCDHRVVIAPTHNSV